MSDRRDRVARGTYKEETKEQSKQTQSDDARTQVRNCLLLLLLLQLVPLRLSELKQELLQASNLLAALK